MCVFTVALDFEKKIGQDDVQTVDCCPFPPLACCTPSSCAAVHHTERCLEMDVVSGVRSAAALFLLRMEKKKEKKQH